jgi:hypothetical protein
VQSTNCDSPPLHHVFPPSCSCDSHFLSKLCCMRAQSICIPSSCRMSGSYSGRYEDVSPCSTLRIEHMFRGKKLLPHSRSKSNPRKTFAYCLLHSGFLLGVFFNTKDGNIVFLRNSLACILLRNICSTLDVWGNMQNSTVVLAFVCYFWAIIKYSIRLIESFSDMDAVQWFTKDRFVFVIISVPKFNW